MSQTVKYLIKLKNAPFDLYVSNRFNNPEGANYSRDKRRAREFDGLDDASIDMTHHVAIKKTVTETVDYEEVKLDDWTT